MANSVNQTGPAPEGRRLLAAFCLVCGMLALELGGAILANSLALAADAGHLLVDAVGLTLALGALRLGARRPDAFRTFGYRRLEILAAIANAALMFGIGGFVLGESILRLLAPPLVTPGPMIVVAALSLVGNAAAFWLLRPVRAGGINLRAAYLEVTSDLAGSGAVLAAGIFIALTGFGPADVAASLLIGAFIVPRTWRLLREGLDVLLEATPRGIDLVTVRAHILEAPGVVGAHDLHVWSISSGVNVVSAHILIEPETDSIEVLDHLCDCLAGFFDIEHSTFQIERIDRREREPANHD
jgi:cobalt-zinc-cadmium efflux system protein